VFRLQYKMPSSGEIKIPNESNYLNSNFCSLHYITAPTLNRNVYPPVFLKFTQLLRFSFIEFRKYSNIGHLQVSVVYFSCTVNHIKVWYHPVHKIRVHWISMWGGGRGRRSPPNPPSVGPYFWKPYSSSAIKKLPGPEGSLPYSKQPATCTNNEPDESSPHPHILPLLRAILILSTVQRIGVL
jgi:hypothetical protein